MDANPAPEDAAVITSLPDISELSGLDLAGWRAWFVGAARRVIRWAPRESVAIFYQSDVRLRGEWIDKGYLVMRAAEDEGASVVWHKIVCRRPPGTVAPGRPSYSHMICVARAPRGPGARPGPDVLPDAGFMPWSRAMGVAACRVACAFLRDETRARVVVDPFCGQGTALAVANAMGFDAIGVDLGGKRCRAARALVVTDEPPPGGASPLDTGAALFDQGAYWEAHEAWESEWRRLPEGPERRRVQGCIQIAAALHHQVVLKSGGSAGRLLQKGLAKLGGGRGGPLASFIDGVAACSEDLAAGRFDAGKMPKIAPVMAAWPGDEEG